MQSQRKVKPQIDKLIHSFEVLDKESVALAPYWQWP